MADLQKEINSTRSIISFNSHTSNEQSPLKVVSASKKESLRYQENVRPDSRVSLQSAQSKNLCSDSVKSSYQSMTKFKISPKRCKSPINRSILTTSSQINVPQSTTPKTSVSPNRQPRRTRAERLKQKEASPAKGSLMVGKSS